jgi:hypothetical protein
MDALQGTDRTSRGFSVPISLVDCHAQQPYHLSLCILNDRLERDLSVYSKNAPFRAQIYSSLDFTAFTDKHSAR